MLWYEKREPHSIIVCVFLFSGFIIMTAPRWQNIHHQCYQTLFTSAWSGLPEPENPTGFDVFFKPEPEKTRQFGILQTRLYPNPKVKPAGTRKP